MNTSQKLIIVLGFMLLASCGGQRSTLPSDTGGETAAPASSATTGGAGQTRAPQPEPLAPERPGPLDTVIVYFDFDSSDIRAEYNDALIAHARNLSSQGRARLRLEGHADERGSREYNIGLGERRAQAVRRFLMLQGSAAGQLSTVSFGEERAAASGSSERSWSRNRRVELVYNR